MGGHANHLSSVRAGQIRVERFFSISRELIKSGDFVQLIFCEQKEDCVQPYCLVREFGKTAGLAVEQGDNGGFGDRCQTLLLQGW
ncbi:hypothetical protein KSP39_PZI018835 [Platanthera zijinensis]|uniref:Uncharacterized protein n=1 Tax=Platanthera zijinensis TaxID=2320716 RepID=A0AAP0FYA3_9ASPA